MPQTNIDKAGLTQVEQCFDGEETQSLTHCVNISCGSVCDPHFGMRRFSCLILLNIRIV